MKKKKIRVINRSWMKGHNRKFQQTYYILKVPCHANLTHFGCAQSMPICKGYIGRRHRKDSKFTQQQSAMQPQEPFPQEMRPLGTDSWLRQVLRWPLKHSPKKPVWGHLRQYGLIGPGPQKAQETVISCEIQHQEQYVRLWTEDKLSDEHNSHPMND